MILLRAITLAVLMLSLFPNSCSKDKPEAGALENGEIIREDYRRCACCGGWFIAIGSDTLRARRLPEEFLPQIDRTQFPMPVRLSWEREPESCLDDEIRVLAIERRD